MKKFNKNYLFITLPVLASLLMASPLMLLVFLYSSWDRPLDRLQAIQSYAYIVAVVFSIISLRIPLFLICVALSVVIVFYAYNQEVQYREVTSFKGVVEPRAENVCRKLSAEVFCRKQNNGRYCRDISGEVKTSVIESCEESGYSFRLDEPIIIVGPE